MHFPALTPRRLTGLLATIVCTAALIPAAALAATASPGGTRHRGPRGCQCHDHSRDQRKLGDTRSQRRSDTR